ncbi:MAG TPA: hypothetical protein VHB47_24100 [Thermoanaerobaculia bacterium]|nr:hypothetical protein [Thermoanaerobaculia bacterium]
MLLGFLAASAATAAAAAATPAPAGQVFIPVAGHHAPGSLIAYRTEVWVTNPGQAAAQAVARFVEQGADGTAPHAGEAAFTVPAGATVLLVKAAPNGEGGMLEISAAAALEVRARLDALPASGASAAGDASPAGLASDAVDGIEVIAGPEAIDAIEAMDALAAHAELSELPATGATERSGPSWSSTAMQAVSAAGVLGAGDVAHLQGLGRQPGGEVTDLGLLNLSGQAARCQVSAFASDGSRVAAPATVSLPPLGTLQLEDAFGSLGEQRLSGGRFEVSCDQQFYAYAAVFAAGGSVIEAVAPSQSLAYPAAAGSAAAVAPAAPPDVAGTAGAGLDPAAAPAGATVPQRSTSASGVVTLVVPGTFLHATATNSFISYDLAAPRGLAYHRATVDFDLTISDFNHVLLFTGVTSFRRPNKNRKDRVLYYAMQLVNRNQKTILDLGVENRLVRTPGPWQAGHTYHLTFTYDLRGRQVKLDLFENGQHIYQIAGAPLHFDLSANANPLTVDFGQTGIGDGAYGPPLGWTYANLNVQLQP